MSDKKLNDKKLWESAYSVLNHPRTGPYMHGAGMVEKTTGVTHYWLVRGPCTQSVVRVLQSQLTQAYKGRPAPVTPPPAPAPKAEPPKQENRYSDRILAGFLMAGICAWVLGALTGRK